MDELILEQNREGKFDSAGQFSLASKQAWSLDFCLSDPEEFALLLVIWASQSKARCCQFKIKGGQLSFTHDGLPPSLSQLAKLSQGTPYSLALAVKAALQLKPRRLSIEVPEGIWNPSKIDPKPATKRFRLRLQLPLWHRFKRVQDLLHQRCRYSTLAVELNGKKVNHPLDLSSSLASLAMLSAKSQLPSFQPAQCHYQACWDEAYSVVLGTEPGALETQVHGVGRSQESPYLGLVVSSRLLVDASLLEPIRDAVREARLKELWQELASRCLENSALDPEKMARLVEALLEASGEDSTQRRSLLIRRLKLAKQRSEVPLRWLTELAQFEGAEGRYQQALHYWQQAYQVKKQLASAEGILECLSHLPDPSDCFEQPLKTVLEAHPPSAKLDQFCHWLWHSRHRKEAYLSHRRWLPTLQDPKARSLCIQRLITLTQHLGLRLEEENYRNQVGSA